MSIKSSQRWQPKVSDGCIRISSTCQASNGFCRSYWDDGGNSLFWTSGFHWFITCFFYFSHHKLFCCFRKSCLVGCEYHSMCSFVKYFSVHYWFHPSFLSYMRPYIFFICVLYLINTLQKSLLILSIDKTSWNWTYCTAVKVILWWVHLSKSKRWLLSVNFILFFLFLLEIILVCTQVKTIIYDDQNPFVVSAFKGTIH